MQIIRSRTQPDYTPIPAASDVCFSIGYVRPSYGPQIGCGFYAYGPANLPSFSRVFGSVIIAYGELSANDSIFTFDRQHKGIAGTLKETGSEMETCQLPVSVLASIML